jgi:hypothetical protein
MRLTRDEALHEVHTEAFLRQIATNTIDALDQFNASPSIKKDLAIDILYGICNALDGAAHGGTLGNEPISPFIGFYLNGETTNVLVPEDGSHMHEFIRKTLDEIDP